MLPTWTRRNWCQLGICCLLLLLTGCVKKSVVDGASIYSIEWWATALTVVGSIGLGAYGLYLRGQDWRGWILVVVGVGGLLLGAPSIALDRTVVDARHFETRHGFWVAPSVQNVSYDNLSGLNLHEKVSWRKGRKRVSYEFQCRMKDGSTVTVPLGDVMKEAAAEIIVHVQGRGIPITGLGL